MALDGDGRFEIILSPERPANCRNWLRTKTDPEMGLLIVRQTYLDKSTEQLADVQIEVHGKPTVPTPFSAERLDDGLHSASLMLTGATLMFAKWAHGFQKHTNQLPLFDQALSGKKKKEEEEEKKKKKKKKDGSSNDAADGRAGVKHWKKDAES